MMSGSNSVIKQANLNLNLVGPGGRGVIAQIKEKFKETDLKVGRGWINFGVDSL